MAVMGAAIGAGVVVALAALGFAALVWHGRRLRAEGRVEFTEREKHDLDQFGDRLRQRIAAASREVMADPNFDPEAEVRRHLGAALATDLDRRMMALARDAVKVDADGIEADIRARGWAVRPTPQGLLIYGETTYDEALAAAWRENPTRCAELGFAAPAFVDDDGGDR